MREAEAFVICPAVVEVIELLMVVPPPAPLPINPPVTDDVLMVVKGIEEVSISLN